MRPYYITTAIPYVNAAPHLGHALEFVQADVLARHRRLRGYPVRFLSGTDDNALKNVIAARNARIPVADYVASAADRFEVLQTRLELSCDDYIRTSSDTRHRRGVEFLWQRCVDSGDFYQHTYEGLHCIGCEQFYEAESLAAGLCPEHGTAPERVTETNWFFRLSRYGRQIKAVIESEALTINPPQKRNEVLALIDAGLKDFSVSRPSARADGWGIPVPSDPSQVIYVWWDALTNYITALGVDQDGDDYRYWWCGDGERVHIIGKGITRFHAVYWIGLLLSAGRPLPTTIHVHDYVNAGGTKLSKSTGNVVDPTMLIDEFGINALRWWMTREVPLLGDTEFTTARLVQAYNNDLANGLGNLANRTLTLLHKHYNGQLHPADKPATGPRWSSLELETACAELPSKIDTALQTADFRSATGHLIASVDVANQLLNAAEPWKEVRTLDADPRRTHRLLSTVARACRTIATELTPFCPTGAAILIRQLGVGNRVEAPEPVFARLP
ncbi:methionine--tRNA ligase [Aestuariimicrobium sp. T2.26MG-19.2B]|uniref:methionine--tRNA ligase n=1 Tax=Aestuariimicrobium sp. T2.26MG-19.2B TaxID=3040679 RepID=UPI0024778ABE|nr:methionine--tRNA ligase [Aestuariimicrobium sp. T2.26MG-19.2B]CAI9411716.1 Methionine--tRNA ligase [Aestuariimicrobium sp. T2.26MG-19.2B]